MRFRPLISALLGVAVLLAGCGKDRIEEVQTLTPGAPAQEEEPSPQDEDYDPDHVAWEPVLDEVFRMDKIAEIHLEVPEDQWNTLLDAYDANHDTQAYVTASVRIVLSSGETVVPDAGLRLKGNTSRRRPEDGSGHHVRNGAHYRHCHYGIDLQHNQKDWEHSVSGFRRFDLKWFKDDPAYAREIFCYDLFRRTGVWTAVRDSYARLWLRVGEDREESYLGVYELMEHIDKDYLRARKEAFGHKGGNLWKCRGGANLRYSGASMGADTQDKDYTYTLKTNKTEGLEDAKAQLKDFIGKLNRLQGAEFSGWIGSVMDVPLLLRTYAVNVAVGMWDDYWNNANNYYLYFNTTDKTSYKVFFIPYDYDNTLGTSLACGVQTDSGTQDPFHWGSDDNPLIAKILDSPGWRSYYKECLQALCADDGPMSFANASARIREWEAMVEPYVDNDTGEDTKIQDKPAFWGNHREYRLLGWPNNFFSTKAASVAAME